MGNTGMTLDQLVNELEKAQVEVLLPPGEDEFTLQDYRKAQQQRGSNLTARKMQYDLDELVDSGILTRRDGILPSGRRGGVYKFA